MQRMNCNFQCVTDSSVEGQMHSPGKSPLCIGVTQSRFSASMTKAMYVLSLKASLSNCYGSWSQENKFLYLDQL